MNTTNIQSTEPTKTQKYTYLKVLNKAELTFSVESHYITVMRQYIKQDLELFAKLRAELNKAMIIKGEIMENYVDGLVQIELQEKNPETFVPFPLPIAAFLPGQTYHKIMPQDSLKEKLAKLRLLYLDDLKSVVRKIDSLKSAIPKEIGVIPYLDYITILNAVSEWTAEGYINSLYIPERPKKPYTSHKAKGAVLDLAISEQMINALAEAPSAVLDDLQRKLHAQRVKRGIIPANEDRKT